MYCMRMPKNKRRVRPQSPKSRSLDTRAMLLRNGDGPHKPATDYRRRPKHRGQGWEQD